MLNRRAADGEYIKTPDELELLDGAAEGVRLLNDGGMLVVVVTNQRGVALGRLTTLDLAQIHSVLRQRLAARGARLDGIYHCPHPLGSCDCRKPGIGLFVRARQDHPEIDFNRSAVIGDSLSDMTAAQRIGARGILIVDVPTGSTAGTANFELAGSLLDAARRLVE